MLLLYYYWATGCFIGSFIRGCRPYRGVQLHLLFVTAYTCCGVLKNVWSLRRRRGCGHAQRQIR